jgi:hypothetical protein
MNQSRDICSLPFVYSFGLLVAALRKHPIICRILDIVIVQFSRVALQPGGSFSRVGDRWANAIEMEENVMVAAWSEQ